MANPDHDQVDFKVTRNSRFITEISVEGRHLSIDDLKLEFQKDCTIWNKLCELGSTNQGSKIYSEKPRMLDYLSKTIQSYPKPVEFHVANVAHVTEKNALLEIWKSEKFRPNNTEFSWWDLKITDEEINSAEKRYLETNKATSSYESQEPFLKKFTTSPLFQTHESRYGNYRFTFPLAELLERYKEQNCGGKEPVLRVFKTIAYKQEIVYAVLIHSPEYNEHFGAFPALEDSKFVGYRDGKIIWKAQAISETHRYQFLSGELEYLPSHVFYVWDQVSVVFHLPVQASAHIKVTKKRLINALEICTIAKIHLTRNETKAEPEALLKCLKKEVEDMEEVVSGSEKELKEESETKLI
ncbi:uncharacterized protein LOC118242318 [Electrophorus electricus]|uniref:uncharacterized protein LOC118242318 n=1 Tax=Electrophorus electricus TaxID=8005 RepID=UPI0015CF946F|nr:uncharacterized protein LOC118242318 [Electrophorus electricus]XP_035388394.1 uncharacterized protein LOC118242318 [Electrophorus electricus]XP_035388395.1 uncharacterized protein LOC118242318 [Electrophorus electricus]